MLLPTIRSGEARLILISSKVFTGATGLNGLVESSWFMSIPKNGGGGGGERNDDFSIKNKMFRHYSSASRILHFVALARNS